MEENTVSPRKIRRVDSDPVGEKNSRQSLFPRQSRETVTSTPSKKDYPRRMSISSEVSSIEKQLTSSLHSINLLESTVTSSLPTILEDLSLNETTNLENESQLLRASSRNIYKGKTWKFLKPKHERTLYFKVITYLESIEETALELLNNFETNPQKSTLDLIKFFIDICGYQAVKVERYLTLDEKFNTSCEKFIKSLEFDLVDEEILDNDSYIFQEASKESSKLGKTLAAAIYKFLRTFFFNAYRENLLFEIYIHKYIFLFVIQMCQAVLRSIRHTGIVITREILKSMNSIIDECAPEEELVKERIQKYIPMFFRIFAKNNLIPDSHFSALKVENAKAMLVWTIKFPEIYFIQCYEIFVKLIVDDHANVRLAILDILSSLIKSKLPHNSTKMRDMATIIRGRTNDINSQVVLKAIETLTVLLENYESFIDHNDISFTSEKIYSKNYLYAKAAAGFILKTFEATNADPDTQLRRLVEFSNAPAFIKMKPLFIEAFSEYDTTLKDYEFLLNILLRENPKFAQDLIELIYHSMYQELNGESSLKRMNSNKEMPTRAKIENIAGIFLPQIDIIFEIYKDNGHVLSYVLKCLCLIDYDVLPPQYMEKLQDVIANCKDMFFHGNYKELRGNICDTFKYLKSKKKFVIKDYLNNVLSSIFETASNQLNDLHSDVASPQNFEDDFNILRILFEKFDVKGYSDWGMLYMNFGCLLQHEGQIVSCKQYLIYFTKDFLRTLRTNEEINTRIQTISLKKYYSDFTKSLLQVITSKSTKNVLKSQAFLCMCTLHTSLDELLYKNGNVEELRTFLIENFENNISNELIENLKTIIDDASLPLERRKSCVKEWLTILLNGVLDIIEATHIFECYHKYSEYETLLDSAADKIYEMNSVEFFNLILMTLEQAAETELIIKKIPIAQAENLMMLAGKFANMKQFTGNSKAVHRMINLGTKYAFKEKLFEFLIVLQIFIPKLTSEHKEECRKFFVNLTPIVHEKQHFVVHFRTKLTTLDKNTGAIKKTYPQNQSSSSSKSKETPKNKKKKVKIPKNIPTGSGRRSDRIPQQRFVFVDEEEEEAEVSEKPKKKITKSKTAKTSKK